MKDATVITETSELANNQSLPRPWLMNSHVETVPSGIQNAAIVRPAKIAAAGSHFAPSTTRVSGRARANNTPAHSETVPSGGSATLPPSYIDLPNPARRIGRLIWRQPPWRTNKEGHRWPG